MTSTSPDSGPEIVAPGAAATCALFAEALICAIRVGELDTVAELARAAGHYGRRALGQADQTRVRRLIARGGRPLPYVLVDASPETAVD